MPSQFAIWDITTKQRHLMSKVQLFYPSQELRDCLCLKHQNKGICSLLYKKSVLLVKSKQRHMPAFYLCILYLLIIIFSLLLVWDWFSVMWNSIPLAWWNSSSLAHIFCCELNGPSTSHAVTRSPVRTFNMSRVHSFPDALVWSSKLTTPI